MIVLASPLETLPAAIAAACHRDLRDIEHAQEHQKTFDRDVIRRKQGKSLLRRPGQHDIRVMLFPQSWDAPTLGLTRLDRSPDVLAYTVVVCTKAEACVYFGNDSLAYRVNFTWISPAQAQAWSDDCAAHSLVHQDRARSRYGASME